MQFVAGHESWWHTGDNRVTRAAAHCAALPVVARPGEKLAVQRRAVDLGNVSLGGEYQVRHVLPQLARIFGVRLA
ncbi:hypothetical protein ACQP1P_41900 [Dactylosporangium sp. CA-052675]|uniref:hypothetical protein n=1 Tax=Dactylosporangium sp. CA-052675 TaxID=3239927 RepID=UPI003D90BA15